MIERAAIRPYRLPLRRLWQSARGELNERCGWLLSVESSGICGYGDCAPLPSAGTETPQAAERALHRWRDWIIGRTLEEVLVELDQSNLETPAAQYAVESAILDLSSRRAGIPLRRWISAKATDAVPVSTMLGTLGHVTKSDVEGACREGFRVLKVKVGIGEPAVEIARLRDLAESLPPRVSLRLDANGAWFLADATRVIEALAGLPFESIEEPLRRPDLADLAGLQALAPFPLALDESLHESGAMLDPSRIPVRRVVLKPAVIGGLRSAVALAHRFQAAGIEVVITSLVESAAGLWPTAQVAAAIGSPIPHGLATGPWLAGDLGIAPAAQGGRLLLPERPGSGFDTKVE